MPPVQQEGEDLRRVGVRGGRRMSAAGNGHGTVRRRYARTALWSVTVILGVLAVGDFFTRRLFFGATRNGDVQGAAWAVNVNPRLIRAEDEWRATGLNIAVEKGDLAMVKMLLSMGADAHHEAQLTGLPLHHAAWGS
jgi:hypothetical protein